MTDALNMLAKSLLSLIGLTHMGILHNLARSSESALPDHAGGGVREWVAAESFTLAFGRDSAPSFDLIVAGTPSGSVTLDIGPSGLPAERHQTVRFPSGDMHLVERYSDVTIEH